MNYRYCNEKLLNLNQTYKVSKNMLNGVCMCACLTRNDMSDNAYNVCNLPLINLRFALDTIDIPQHRFIGCASFSNLSVELLNHLLEYFYNLGYNEAEDFTGISVFVKMTIKILASPFPKKC